MKKPFLFIVFVGLYACDANEKTAEKPYVLTIGVETYERSGSEAVVEKMETDTVKVSSALAAYSKGVQKYASVLMHVERFPDSIKGTKGLKIFDAQGNDIVPTIPQTQRDSVIMNFIQFARRSDIPYYERVKDFELKLMTAR